MRVKNVTVPDDVIINLRGRLEKIDGWPQKLADVMFEPRDHVYQIAHLKITSMALRQEFVKRGEELLKGSV